MKLRYGIVGAVLILGLAAGGIATAIGDGETGSDGPTDTPTQSESFVGLSISEAAALAEDEGRPWRIGRQDDESLALTDDLVPGRVTFEIDDGMITGAFIETTADREPDTVSADDFACVERVVFHGDPPQDFVGYDTPEEAIAEAAVQYGTPTRADDAGSLWLIHDDQGSLVAKIEVVAAPGGGFMAGDHELCAEGEEAEFIPGEEGGTIVTIVP